MTIHHDKSVYGKLDPLRDDFSQDRLDAMTQDLNGEDCRGEYERMIAGELYCPSDERLTEMRTRVRRLVREYNLSDECETEKRRALLHAVFGEHGPNIFCEPPLRFDYGVNTRVGDFFFSNFNLVILDCAPVTIGKQCFIGPNVTIATPVHPLLPCDRNMRVAANGGVYDYEYAKPIVIGDNVWLASNVVVCGGVTIGDGAVIGAGSVVTRSIPSGVFAAGNPCRVIRPITEKDKMPDREPR